MKLLFIVLGLLISVAIATANNATKEPRETMKRKSFNTSPPCNGGLIPTEDGLRCRLKGEWVQVGQNIYGKDGCSLFTGARASLSGNGRRVLVDTFSAYDDFADTATVYERDNSDPIGWKKIGNTIPVYDKYGNSISRRGDIITVGNTSHVQAYKLNNAKTEWVPLGSRAIDGNRVSLSGDGKLMAVAADLKSVTARVYSFENGDWVQVGKGQRVRGQAKSQLKSHSIAMSGDGSTFAMGDPYHKTGGPKSSNRGKVSVLRRNRATNKFEPLGGPILGTPDAFAGYRIALSRSGRVLAVSDDAGYGKEGGVVVYRYFRKDDKWKPLGDRFLGTTFNGTAEQLGRSGPAPNLRAVEQLFHARRGGHDAKLAVEHEGRADGLAQSLLQQKRRVRRLGHSLLCEIQASL